MSSFITLPQAPVVAGETGHLTDHNNIEAGLLALWTAVQQSMYNVCSPTYGADPTGAADSSTAIQNAINAAQAAGGGIVCIPAGTFKVAPNVLTLNNGVTGYNNVRIIGAGAQSTVLKKSANGTLISMSGPATDTTGATHAKYCSLEQLHLSGNGNTGLLLQLYYADDLFFRDLDLVNNADVMVDSAEFWDSRFYNCTFESGGSATANASTPNVLLRCSAAASGFGASVDSVNNIHFIGCRWEGFRTGAVWIQQGVSATGVPFAIMFEHCKMESIVINGGPHLLVDSSCEAVFVDNLYAFSGGFAGGYSTAQDVITWGAQDGALRNVYISTNAVQTVANGVTMNSTKSGQNTLLQNVTAIYNASGMPTGNHIAYGTGTGGFRLINCYSNQTAPTTLNPMDTLVSPLSTNNALGMLVSGDTVKRLAINFAGNMSWGSGSGAADVVMGRSATGVLALTAGIFQAQNGIDTHNNAAVLTPTFANGTAAQLSDTTRDYLVYLTVGTAGTAFTVAIGPTSTPANTIVPSGTATSGQVVSFRLPAGWFVKWSATTATLAGQKAIGC